MPAERPGTAVPGPAGVASPLRGVLWMAASAALFAGLLTLVRILSERFDPLLVVFFRNIAGLVVLSPLILQRSRRTIRTRCFHLHALRAGITIVQMTVWFLALAWLPLADATALGFTAPLFTTLLAPLVLKETVPQRRYGAAAIGLAGAMVILQPGLQAFDPLGLLAVAAAFGWAVAAMVVKKLARTESAETMVVWLTLLLTPLSLVPALVTWSTPGPADLMLIALLGLVGTGAQLCLGRAFVAADASVIAPFDYLRLPFVAAIAFVLFGEVPGAATWLGAAVIGASGVYLARGEIHDQAQQAHPR
jgi:drug/metabolite transporter (DMT)-like permease